MNFSDKDSEFMNIAINEAKIALDEGNFPVGACLVIDGKLVAQDRNSIKTNKDWISHAEMKLLLKYASLIKESIKNEKSEIILYTSLEPCLMCFGAGVLNRISKIIYACPDPFTGATHIHKNLLPIGYRNILPEISGGLMKENSYYLVVKCMEKADTDKWKEALALYKQIKF